MAAILSTNMASLYAQRSMVAAQAELSGSVEKLSSGKRINSAKDDAAGLGIAESVSGVRSITDRSVKNMQSATSLVQNAQGALDIVGKILQRTLTLVTQRSDLVLNQNQKDVIDNEIKNLVDEIEKIRNRTTFNDSSTIFGKSYTFGSGYGVTKVISIDDLNGVSLGLETIQSVSLMGSVSSSGSFNISNSFTGGEVLQYFAGSGSPIGGLTSGSTYTVVNNTSSSFQLASGGSTISIASVGTSNDDYFLNISSVPTTYTVGAVSGASTTDVLQINQSWSNGDEVIFSKGTASLLNTTLTDATVYTVNSRTASSLKLLPLGGTVAATYSFGADLTGSSLTLIDTLTTSRSPSTVDLGNNYITYSNSFTNGQAIKYSTTGTPIAPLINNGAYYVTQRDSSGFKLASSYELATAGSAIDLTTATSSFVISFSSDPATSNVSIGSILPSNTISLSTSASGISIDTILKYTNTSDPIGGLTSGNSYYVVNKSGNNIQLSTSSGGSVIAITAPTTASNSSFALYSAISFDATSTGVVTLASSGSDVLRTTANHLYSTGDSLVYSSSGSGLSGLSSGNTYYVIKVSDTDFKLASSRENALAGTAIGITSDGGGVNEFTKYVSSIDMVREAITRNALNQGKLGAQLNAIEYSIENLTTLSNDLSIAQSRIMDVDYAKETSTLTRARIMQEAAAAMLSQANQMPNVILSLLK